MMRKWVVWGLRIILFCLVILAGGIIYILSQKSELQEYIVDELNKHINATVNVSSIDITLLHSFPRITATFSEVTIVPYHQLESVLADTLLKVNKVYVDVDLLKLLRKKEVDIKSVEGVNGEIHLHRGKGERTNWNIIKTASPTTQGKPLIVRMIQGKNLRITYQDQVTAIDIEGLVDQCKLNKMQGGGNAFRLKMSGGLTSGSWGQWLAIDNAQEFILSSTIENKKEKWATDNTRIIWEGKVLEVEGGLKRDENSNLSVIIRGNDIEPLNTAAALHIIPEKTTQKWKERGGWNTTLTVEGSLKKDGWLKGSLQFNTRKYSLMIPGKDIDMTVEYAEGTYLFSKKNRDKQAVIKLDRVALKVDKSEVKGNLTWDQPSSKGIISGNLEGTLELPVLSGIIGDETMAWESGILSGEIQFTMPAGFSDGKVVCSFDKVNASGKCSLENATGGKRQSLLYTQEANGKFTVGKTINVTELQMKWLNFPVRVEGTIPPVADFFNHSKNQHYELEVETPVFVLDTLLAKIRRDEDSTDEQGIETPWDLKCGVDIQQFSFKNIVADQVQGTLLVDHNGVQVNGLTYHAFDGEGSGQCEWISDPEKGIPVFKAYSDIKQVDVTKLFRAFHDFGQQVVVSENIEGTLTGNLAFQTHFTPDGDIDPSSVLANATFEVTKGRLKNVEALYSLSKFFRLSELEDIHFSALQNEIFIQNNTVIIPSMHIGSSVMDLDLYGTHTFQNNYVYHIKLLLSDILFRKARKARKDAEENNPYGIVEKNGDEGTNIYLLYQGNNESSSVVYDKDRAKQARKENMSREGKTLKSILQQDLGLFRKDTLQQYTTPTERKKFRLLFPDQQNSVKKDTADSGASRPFSVSWDDEIPDTTKKK